MGTTLSTLKQPAGTLGSGVAADTWGELVGAMPIVIFYRAVREALRQRAHRRAVLEALRR